jgi:phosphoribosylaminoimidazole-succinocarboxamide synthase
MAVITNMDIQGAKKISSGKVREIFEVDNDRLIIVTTDRLSAFDVILSDPIPYKGQVLNQLSLFWLDKTKDIIKNHVISSELKDYPHPFNKDERLAGRSMLVKKAKPLTIECVVRGYLAGSGWADYKKHGSICGIKLPAGMVESQKFENPIFTPTTKAELGLHDESIDMETAAKMIGKDLAEKTKNLSIKLYSFARDLALERGIIVADTKFEFGLIGEELLLIDEVLTPDSSRFWPLDSYAPGKSQPSFDKQFVRDYLNTLNWGKTPPAPRLPKEIIEKTSEKYIEAYERITGKPFEKIG